MHHSIGLSATAWGGGRGREEEESGKKFDGEDTRRNRAEMEWDLGLRGF